jgi:hypothetical protein
MGYFFYKERNVKDSDKILTNRNKATIFTIDIRNKNCHYFNIVICNAFNIELVDYH